jgi:hypothetical protein
MTQRKAFHDPLHHCLVHTHTDLNPTTDPNSKCSLIHTYIMTINTATVSYQTPTFTPSTAFDFRFQDLTMLNARNIRKMMAKGTMTPSLI